MSKQIFALGIGLVLVVGLLVWLRGCIDRGFVPLPSQQAPSLPVDVQERVYVDAERHTLSTVARTDGHEVVTQHYVPRHAVVDVHSNGTVDVRIQTWGLDLAPEVGVGFGTRLSLYCGISTLYYGRYSLVTMAGLEFQMNDGPKIEGAIAVKRDFSGGFGLWLGTSTRFPIKVGASYRFAGWRK